jgi:hypothetical protein
MAGITILNQDGQKISGAMGNSSAKILGAHLLLDAISDNIGLKDTLMKVFPDKWKEILTLSHFLITTKESVRYCQNWTENYFNYFENANLQLKTIIDLFKNIKYSDILEFYKLWLHVQSENDYIALDIASISPYARLINNVEPYNYQNDDSYAPVNFCILLGERSGLPAYSSTLDETLDKPFYLARFVNKIDILSTKKYKITFDKEAYSLKRCYRSKYTSLSILTNDKNIDYKRGMEIYKNIIVNVISFYRIKNSLCIKTRRYYDKTILDSKLFIATISLIIISKTHSIMKKDGYYEKFTLIDLLKYVEQFKLIKHNDNIIFTPLTEQCLDIFKSFNVKIDFID